MSVTQTRDTVWGGSNAAGEAQLSGISSRLLKALGFEILMILVNVIGALVMVGATIGMATLDNFTGVTLYFGYLVDGVPAAFFVTGAVLTVVMTIRTWRMVNAANRGDIPALQKLSSLGWAVVALIFSGIVPGILLLRANRSIRGLTA